MFDDMTTPQPDNNRPLDAGDLLSLASRAGALGRTGRNENGNLADWELWTTSHPQRDQPVDVCTGRSHDWTSASSSRRDSHVLSVLSWNILSDTWFRMDRKGVYAHTAEEDGGFEIRFRRLVRWVESLRPDVVALQEVDFALFDSRLLPAMREIGYDGRVQRFKKVNDKQPCGNATFWMSSELELADDGGVPGGTSVVKTFSRALGTVLKLKKYHRCLVCVVNVHLESAQTEAAAEKRARQMRSALKWAEEEASGFPLVICGDFNTGADSWLSRVMREHRWHSHGLASAYEHPAAADTTAASRATFAVPGHHYFIDQMWYSYDSMRLMRLLDPLTEEEQRVCLGSGDREGGLPNHVCPSDHIPIGAVFELSEPAGPSVASLGLTTKNLSLRSCCSERRAELSEKYNEFASRAPKKGKGKPSPDEIARLKAHASAVKEWMHSLPEEEKLFVKGLKKKK